MSRRRDPNASSGFVKFPTDTIENSGEGGMLVRLVVIDTKGDEEYMNRWIPCCGGYQSFFMDEIFLGDDQFDRSYPDRSQKEGLSVSEEEYDKFLSEAYNERSERYNDCESRYWPKLSMIARKEEDEEQMDRYRSRDFLCVMTLGGIGWSSSEWVCTFDDLTDEGKVLVDSLRKMYDGCEIRLLTFLDT